MRFRVMKRERKEKDPVPVDGKAKLLGRVLSALALFSGLVGIISFVYYWDPTRTAIKRLQASDPYLYERIDPKSLKVDPASLLFIKGHNDAEAVRRKLISVFWPEGRLPTGKQPLSVVQDLRSMAFKDRCPNPAREDYTTRTLGCSLELYDGLENLAAIELLTVATGPAYQPRVSHFKPKNGNRRLVVYHHGYAGTHQDQWRHIRRWIEKGYGVLAFDYVGYGNAAPGVDYDGAAYLRSVFEPITVALNHVLEAADYREINMVGLSAGGWVTAVYAALDPRINKSYPVSGVLPVYLRRKKERAEPQFFAPMLEAATYLDMFVLAAYPEGRRQVQFFNRFDRCCFNNTRGKLYEEDVAKIARSLGGAFKVVVDETHARHKISRWTFEEILKDMERP